MRRKNALATIMQSFIISVQWALWGYSLAFGPDIGGGLLGGLSWWGLNGVGLTPNANYGATVPHQAYMIFQMMFAVITPALITGAFAERVNYKAFVLFTLVWATVVYDPIAHCACLRSTSSPAWMPPFTASRRTRSKSERRSEPSSFRGRWCNAPEADSRNIDCFLSSRPPSLTRF